MVSFTQISHLDFVAYYKVILLYGIAESRIYRSDCSHPLRSGEVCGYFLMSFSLCGYRKYDEEVSKDSSP